MTKEFKAYSIHYSCDGFYDGGAVAPTICCIAMYNIKTDRLITFSIDRGLKLGLSLIQSEEKLLRDFVDFCKQRRNLFFAHWNMNSLQYGFKAITARCENFGINMFNINECLNFNLDEVSKYNLLDTFDCISYNSSSVLSGKQELICFNKRNYGLVRLSTEAKAIGISQLFKNYTNGEWLTEKEQPIDVETELINTPTALKLYKLLNDIYFSDQEIKEMLNLLKTDENKMFIANIIEKGKRDKKLIQFLAFEYMNKKHLAI